MKFLATTTTLLVLTLMALPLAAQDAAEESVWTKTQLADHIWKLNTDGGGYDVKVIVSAGEDGILIVDAGQKRAAEDLKATIQREWGGAPKIIISTHAHVEHTGGNAIFGPAPIVIGHTQLRTRLRSGTYLFDEYPDHALPEMTFTDSMSLWFNGEEIKLVAFPGAHDDSDIIIWFTKSKVVCVGALSNGKHFPSVDGVGGDIRKYPELSGKVIDLLPDDVQIIPGHGADGTMDDFRRFHSMLIGTSGLVCEAAGQGKDVRAMQDDKLLADYASFDGSYTSIDEWIDYLYDGCQNTRDESSTKEKPYEEMYYAIRDQGVDAAVALYHELKANHPDEYEFAETFPMYIGYKLYTNSKLEAALKFFELSVSEYPEAQDAWMSYYFAASACRDLGDKPKALEHVNRALELNPESETLKTMAEDLQKD